MVKAGLDDTFHLRRSVVKCQFDTSTDALIQLKQSGVSAAVLKAIVSAKVVQNPGKRSCSAEELKDSGAVTALSVIGLVFGLIGMLGSFIPCLGSLAFFVGIPPQ